MGALWKNPVRDIMEYAKEQEWAVADIAKQVCKWDIPSISVQVNTDTRLSISAPHGTVEVCADDAMMVFSISESSSRLRWAANISEWVSVDTGRTLVELLNEWLAPVRFKQELRGLTMLQLDGLKTYFHTEQGVVKAVDGLTIDILPGRTMGLVGESGSGKSVTSLSVMGLLPEFTARIPSGDIVFMGKDLLSYSPKQMREIRGSDMAMIFQEPMTSLNPVYRVGDQVAEAILLHEKVSKAEAWERALALFDEVGIPDSRERARSFPHEMSGGQKQRVMIAMALACNPSLLIADEPTTALDVTIQKQILELLANLRDSRGMSILFITHDLGVIAEIADDVAVMYRGKLCEYGDVLSVFKDPQHPYTRGLLACRPRLDSPYQLLPTVDDFLDTWVEDGEIHVKEKQITDERNHELLNGGRAKRTSFEGAPILTVNNLKVWFATQRDMFGREKSWVKAVDGIDFEVYPGQTLGLVGESGCGKTTTGRAILRLVAPKEGETIFDGIDLSLLEGKGQSTKRVLFGASAVQFIGSFALLSYFLVQAIERGASDAPYGLAGLGGLLFLAGVLFSLIALGRISAAEQSLRRKVQIIFQDPYASLNPRRTVLQTIVEPMTVHKIGATHEERIRKAGDLLEEVGLPREYLRRYPHEFSGGQRQRICIARTLAMNPSLIICDESVSALDVSVQAQVLNLLKDLQIKYDLTYVFISHDLSVVKFMSDTMAVMKGGKIVEMGPSEDIYRNPKQAYTRNLIDSIPKDDLENIKRLRDARVAARNARRAKAVAV